MKLTKKEQEVCDSFMRLYGERNVVKAVAKELGNTPNTIACHFKSIFKKAEVNNKTSLYIALKMKEGK